MGKNKTPNLVQRKLDRIDTKLDDIIKIISGEVKDGRDRKPN